MEKGVSEIEVGRPFLKHGKLNITQIRRESKRIEWETAQHIFLLILFKLIRN